MTQRRYGNGWKVGTKLVGQSSNRDRVNCRQFVALRPSLYTWRTWSRSVGYRPRGEDRFVALKQRDWNLVFIVSIRLVHAHKLQGSEQLENGIAYVYKLESQPFIEVGTITRFSFLRNGPTDELFRLHVNWHQLTGVWFVHNVNRPRRKQTPLPRTDHPSSWHFVKR